MDLTISDAQAAGRYEAILDGQLAGVLEYVLKHERLALVHTGTMPGYEGRGVASALVRFALDDARRRGLRIIPICPYVRSYLERHPEDADIVVPPRPR
jgi:predicted GNAT family acetyltransferase